MQRSSLYLLLFSVKLFSLRRYLINSAARRYLLLFSVKLFSLRRYLINSAASQEAK